MQMRKWDWFVFDLCVIFFFVTVTAGIALLAKVLPHDGENWPVREVQGSVADICGEVVREPVKIGDLNVVFVGKTSPSRQNVFHGAIGAIAGSTEIKLGDTVCLHTFQIEGRIDLLPVAMRQ